MPPVKSNEERVELRVASEDLARWRATAAIENLQLSEWIRRRCNQVAVDQATIDLVKQNVAERAVVAQPVATEPAKRFAVKVVTEERAIKIVGYPAAPEPAKSVVVVGKPPKRKGDR